MPRYTLVALGVDATSAEAATDAILSWARARERRYVCAANVHMVMEAHDSPEFRRVVEGADLVVPDGMPLVFLLRLLGEPEQRRVYGPDLMLRLCAVAAEEGLPVGLVGGEPEVLERLTTRLKQRFDGLDVRCRESPPFRALSAREDADMTERIARSGAAIVFVGLGCPKQERWMEAHRAKIDGVLVGVGAAFDFHAGAIPQAPLWMQTAGLEWSFRLAMEPRRLFVRYAKHNPRFVALALAQLAGLRRSRFHP